MLFSLFLFGIITGSIYSLIAIGFTIIYRGVNFLHFSHGAIYTLGAYSAYTFIIIFRIESIISFFLSILISALLGVVIARFVYYSLKKQKASNMIFLLASFGIFIFIQNLIQLIYGTQILTIRTGPVKEGHHLFDAVITDIQIIILTVAFILMISISLFIQKTKLGKAMRAVADDSMAANVVGINPERIIIISFAIGSALAGIAGILISYETNIEPTMGFTALLKGIIASIIGGIGSIPGAVIGGFFLGLAENLAIWKIQAGWKDAIAFAILIIFLLIRPWGFLGTKAKRETT